MAATFPYSSAETVQMLLSNMPSYGPGFSAVSKPSLATVTYFLNLVGSAVDMSLGEAGYVLPLAAISDETWPTSQTYFLDYLAGLGTAGLIGNTFKPSPYMGPGTETSPGNIFYQQYNTWLKSISLGHMGLRADYRSGTPAEQFLLSPLGPRWSYGDTDFTEMQDVVGFWQSAIEEEAWLLTLEGLAQTYRLNYNVS